MHGYFLAARLYPGLFDLPNHPLLNSTESRTEQFYCSDFAAAI